MKKKNICLFISNPSSPRWGQHLDLKVCECNFFDMTCYHCFNNTIARYLSNALQKHQLKMLICNMLQDFGRKTAYVNLWRKFQYKSAPATLRKTCLKRIQCKCFMMLVLNNLFHIFLNTTSFTNFHDCNLHCPLCA